VSRQYPGYSMLRPSMGPLFRDPKPARLTGNTDPATSRKAAGRVIASGTARADANYLLELIGLFPGHTMPWYRTQAERERQADPPEKKLSSPEWRQKLGRRTGELLEAELVHTRGEEDDCALWWPGPKKDEGH